MGFKVTPATTPEMTSKESEIGNEIKHQFWLADSPKSDDQISKRSEANVSRQFQPRKKHGISEAWSKKMQESREDLKQPFPYTPFKSGSIGRKASANLLLDGSMNIQFNQDLSQIYGVQQHPGHPRKVSSVQGTMRSHQTNGLYGTSVIPRPESKGIWKGSQCGIIPPPPEPYRPASAMDMSVIPRPSPRANSDLGIGTVAFCENVPSRYQSYCTLPRPEQIDVEHPNYYNEISQMAKQMNQLYGPYSVKLQPSNSPNPISKQNLLPNSLAPSSMLVGAPGMGSDYLTRQQSIYGPAKSNVIPQISGNEFLKPAKEIVNFDALSVLSVLQVLCSLLIFGCGVLRIIWNSKWAVGVELLFAAFVFTSGVTGICASSRRSYSAVAATFFLSVLNSVLSLIPLILGALPAIANAFPTLNPQWVHDLNESLAVDYLLSFTCLTETVIAVTTSIYGCRALGLTMRLVERLRFNVDLNAVLENISPVDHKELDGMDNKEAVQ